jgi:hypothetical protein
MLRELVSKARIGPSADLEAMTAERDFFREKYTEQMIVMERLRGELRESQRIIDRLRGRIISDEKSRSLSAGGGDEEGGGKASRLGGRSSTNTSLTSYGDRSLRSDVVDRVSHCDECTNEVADGPVFGDDGIAQTRDIDDAEDGSSAASERSEVEEERTDDGGGSKNDDCDYGDEAERIRANAERMLQWAMYQTTSKRSTTPNASRNADEFTFDGLDDKSKSRRASAGSRDVSESMISSIPMSNDDRQISMLDDDDDSTLDSDSTCHSGRSVGRRIVGSGTTTTTTSKGGKIGRLLNNLRDMIDPPSESESEGERDDDDSPIGISR